MRPQEAHARRESVLFLDVREPSEWASGHIEGAAHIPLGVLPHRLGELERGTPVVTVCRSGARSAQAAALLRSRGFDVDNLDGGMMAWSRAGLPVTRSDRRPWSLFR